jgi:hypothetical protein
VLVAALAGFQPFLQRGPVLRNAPTLRREVARVEQATDGKLLGACPFIRRFRQLHRPDLLAIDADLRSP